MSHLENRADYLRQIVRARWALNKAELEIRKNETDNAAFALAQAELEIHLLRELMLRVDLGQ